MPAHTTTIEGRTITTRILPPDEYDQAYKVHDVPNWNWYSGIVQARGFTVGGEIYIKQNSWGLRRLLAHEIGHVLGYDHTPLPTTMNFTGLLRWLDLEYLLPHADRILEEI